MKLLNHIFSLVGRWYIWTTVAAASLGLLFLFGIAIGAGDLNDEHPDPENMYNSAMRTLEYCFADYPRALSDDPQISTNRSKLRSLVCLDLVVDHVPQYVLLPVVVVGYGSYALDLLYKRVRRIKTEQTAQ